MKIRRRTMLPSICLVALLAACGDEPDPNADEVVIDTLTVQDTIISTASELIGGVSDIAVGADGRIYLADYGFKQILSVMPDGADPRTFGREGEGPGEFQMPWTITVAADSVRVFDMRQARVQKNVEESNPALLHGLNYVVDAASVGEELWLLLNTEESEAGILLVLDAADGSLERRVVLSGLPSTAAFAVDTVRDRMYVAVRDEAMIVAVGLE